VKSNHGNNLDTREPKLDFTVEGHGHQVENNNHDPEDIIFNLMPVAFYGEIEFWFASIKVITVIGFMIFSIPVPEPDIPFLTNAGIHTDREDHEANHGNNLDTREG
jgi:hypothetical protein